MLYHDDCFNVFPKLQESSIDLVLCDMPYGTTACKWDTVIDLERMWKELKRIVKANTAIVLFGVEPFSSVLRVSNIKQFKYDWVWNKLVATGHLNCKKQPMRLYELISIFYKEQCSYNYQITDKPVKNIRPHSIKPRAKTDNYGQFSLSCPRSIPENKQYPKNILEMPRDQGEYYHPTQKPVALMEYLIKTYSNEGDTVLDFCMGSGTTGVACKNLNRGFIGIEKDESYFNIAKERIGV